MPVRVRVLAAVGLALVAVLGPAPAVAASEGSVPAEVADFVTAPDGLIAGLEDFFGPGVDGAGIEFDDSTEFGGVDRVFTFSPAWLAGESADPPVALANQWTVPVTVAGDPVGVAIVWINPNTVRPQLADFVPDPGFAVALPDVPDATYLVRDEERTAWFVLQQPRLLVLVSGTSGVRSETSLASYQKRVTRADEGSDAAEPLNFGSVLSVGTIVAVSLVVILALLVPLAWRRRRARVQPDEPVPDEE